MTDPEYRKRVADLYDWGAVLFREGCGSNTTRQALCRYLNRGRTAGFSQEEVIDFLGLSSPSVLEMAGCDDTQTREIMNLLGTLSDTEIEEAEQ